LSIYVLIELANLNFLDPHSIGIYKIIQTFRIEIFRVFLISKYLVICSTIGLPNQSGTSQAKHYPHFAQVKKSERNRKRCYSVIIPVPGAVCDLRQNEFRRWDKI